MLCTDWYAEVDTAYLFVNYFYIIIYFHVF